MSHSSMSAVEFGAEDLLCSLGQIRLGLKGCEERQVATLPAVLCHPAADQLQGWPKLSLGKLIHQLMQFLAHRAHERILRATRVSAAFMPAPGADAFDSDWARQHRAVSGDEELGLAGPIRRLVFEK